MEALKAKIEYKTKPWKDKPTTLANWDVGLSDYTMFIDENNSNSALENVKNKILFGGTITEDERIFTITGCIFNKKNYKQAQTSFQELKEKYWSNGKWYDKKHNNSKYVCFHSSEIRNKKGSFKLNENYDNFIKDLDSYIKTANYTIISISIDLVEYVLNTSYDLDVYDIAFDFILERFIYQIKNNKGIIMLESRGKKKMHNFCNI